MINVDIAWAYGKAAKYNYREYSPVKVDKKKWSVATIKRILKLKLFIQIDNNLINFIYKVVHIYNSML